MKVYTLKWFLIFLTGLLLVIPSCGEDVKPRKVEFEQIEFDGSSNDRYLFREEIKKERERRKRSQKSKEF